MKYLNFSSSSNFENFLEFDLVKYAEPKFLYDDKGDPVDHFHSPDKELNSNGFRSPEFSSVDLIALGCSQTFGMGVCNNAIWPKVLSEKLGNISYANLAYPGWSATRMVKEFFAYVNKYGTPKFLSILIPDLYRYLFVTKSSVNAGYRKDRHKTAPATEGDFTIAVFKDRYWKEDLLPKISKIPHALEDILTPDFTYYQNLMSLYQLLVFCEATDIAVSVSSWDRETYKKIKDLGTRGLNPKIIASYVVSNKEFNCLNFHDHQNLIAKLAHAGEFDCGLDRAYHMGAHAHLHVADEMYKILKNQIDL